MIRNKNDRDHEPHQEYPANPNKAENRGIDADLFDLCCTRFLENPSLKTMGIHLVYLAPGSAGMKMTAAAGYTTVKNRLHGGIIATLADTVMGWSVVTLGHIGNVTLDMNLNYFAPVFEGTELTAEAVVIHSGRSTTVAEASLYNDQGKLVAKSRGTFFATTGSDNIGAY